MYQFEDLLGHETSLNEDDACIAVLSCCFDSQSWCCGSHGHAEACKPYAPVEYAESEEMDVYTSPLYDQPQDFACT